MAQLPGVSAAFCAEKPVKKILCRKAFGFAARCAFERALRIA
jgi:hypothetical protein